MDCMNFACFWMTASFLVVKAGVHQFSYGPASVVGGINEVVRVSRSPRHGGITANERQMEEDTQSIITGITP